MRMLIHPEFKPDDLAGNALELCELFMLAREEDVPVDSYTIVCDGVEHVTTVGPGKYKSALFLLYLMTKTARPTFELDDVLRPFVGEYFGRRLVADAVQPGSKHTTVRALLGQTVYIRLTLKPGYRECLANGRSPQEIVDQAWPRREAITPAAKEPFLREAIQSFFRQYEDGAFNLSTAADGPWPTQDWADRALDLKQRLSI